VSGAGPNGAAHDADMPDERPPFFGTWPRVYAAVLAWVAVLIFLFWLFSRAFAG